MLQIFTLLLVGACDKIEKCGEDIIQTVYNLQDNIEDSYLRRESLDLVGYLRALAPKITASGLFNINRGIFISIFGIFSNYVIIVLQFRKG